MSRNTVDRLLALREPPRYERARRGSALCSFEDDIVAMLEENPRAAATVILERFPPLAYAELLCRVRDDRVFYANPPLRPNRPRQTGGRPPRHGRRSKCSDRATWPKPQAKLAASDPRYGTVTVTAWHGVHPRLLRRGHWRGYDKPPIVKGSMICLEIEHLPKPTARAKKTLWLWCSGEAVPDLDWCWRAYVRRFDIGWTTPKVRTPEQADRWSWLLVAAYTELRLARGLVEDFRLPSERASDPGQLTPVRVRRGFRRLRAVIGTPAGPPKSHTAGPGRPKGTENRQEPAIRWSKRQFEQDVKV